MQSELAEAKKEIDTLNTKLASGIKDTIMNSAVDVCGIKLVTVYMENLKLDVARRLSDTVKSEFPGLVLVLAIAPDKKLNFITVAGKEAVSMGVHAGRLAGSVASVTGGKGGGRPDSAMAGGHDLSKVDDALATAKGIIEEMIGSK